MERLGRAIPHPRDREVTGRAQRELPRYKTFNDLRRAVAHEQEYDVRRRRWMDCIGRVVTRSSEREIASQIRDWEQGAGLKPEDHRE